MDMGVMCQRRSPCVQNQRSPDACTQMPGIGRNGFQCFGSDVKQQAIHHRLVGISDRADGCWQGEYHMIIIHWQQLGLPCLQPASSRAGLALRAMPLAARVIILNRIRNRVNYVLPSGDGFHPRMVRLKGTKAGDQLVFQRPQTVKGPVVKILLPQLVP